MAGLTLLGSLCAKELKVDIGLNIEPRLYTVLVADSDVKKSTALYKNVEIFNSIIEELYGDEINDGDVEVDLSPRPSSIFGVASAEGLMRQLPAGKQLVLIYDELRAFVDKAGVQNSTLLPMVTSLFESTAWDNTTSRNTKSIRDAHLSLLGCCTSSTYSAMWTPAAMSIGILNRLFIVGAERKSKVAWPASPDPRMVEVCKARIAEQVRRLPMTLAISEEGYSAWDTWYHELPRSEHARRLDTIGFRLLALIALITNKREVDLPTVETVISMLNYELKLRQLMDPIDCDNQIAKLEESIRRALAQGIQTKRDLSRKLHAARSGIWMFNKALLNLEGAGEIKQRTIGKTVSYRLVEDA